MANEAEVERKPREIDPVLMAVLANRLDAITREMSNTMLRTARSAVLAVVRDFSCSIVTGDNRLLSSGEGLPVHIFGSSLQTQSMCDLHENIRRGDAYLHNDPYLGNTHPADHTIMVPVFVEGEHMFTTVAKAHQADCGNSIPSTYHATAEDLYEEGSVIFPCVRIQRDYKHVDDIIRMCRSRIRVPEQWYGDYLAEIGAARIGERRLVELVERYGKETIQAFIREWFDYSERRMVEAIKKLPSGRLSSTVHYDPLPPTLPDGMPIRVDVTVNSEDARIEVDLTHNWDCQEFGLNQSLACATSNAMAGVFNCLEPDIPHNAGSFERVKVKLRENCVTGIPSFPHSCSVATTNIADRIVNATQSAFAQIADGSGLAEGAVGMGAGAAVISGKDFLRGGAPFINQEWVMVNGGPASPRSDGWVNYGLPVAAGLMYRGSIEVDESKYPILFESLRIRQSGGGAGRFRGAPGAEVVYGPRELPLTIVISCDGQHFPPRGVRGGQDGPPAETYQIARDGSQTKVPGVVELRLEKGERVRGLDCGGGGYGPPIERDPARVLHDVLERWETPERAHDVYGVVLRGRVEDESLEIDEEATRERRAQLASAGA